jgi:diguanylate cyclase (GGDEF)-like protein
MSLENSIPVSPAEAEPTEEQLLHQAFQDALTELLHGNSHDPLTGLPNRDLFLQHLGLAIERSKRREGYLFAVLVLDLDRFRVVNDSLGHAVGDHLLAAAARRIKACLRPGDIVARLGGDEFAVILHDLRYHSEALRAAEEIQMAMALPFRADGHEVFSTVSIGVVMSTANWERPEDFFRNADIAMNRAKEMGKARHEVFDKDMYARALTLMRLETDLRRAIRREEFQLHYQPFFSLATGALDGFEALVRWRHPDRGLLPPAEFIPCAEETGLIVAIDRWVLGEACRQMQEWRAAIPAASSLTLGVNFSSRHFSRPDAIEYVSRTLAATGLDPRCLELEITESVFMGTEEVTTESLTRLNALGVQLSVDDFGTGYSSLGYLHRMPIQKLKIDRSFVGRLGDGAGGQEIVKTIHALGRNLGMCVVAEGIETGEQLAELKALGCEYGQGYYFSRPVDARAAGALLGS